MSGARHRTGPGSCGHLGYLLMGVLVDRGQDAFERGLAAERAAALVDVRPELVAELRDVAGDGHGRRVAERAEALAQDPVAHREQQVELIVLGAPILDLVEELNHPARALTA